MPAPPAPPAPPQPPALPKTAAEWAAHLGQLGLVLDSGLIYQRDLPTLEPALQRLIEAYNRRTRRRY